MWDARNWVRSRDLEAFASVAQRLINSIPGHEHPVKNIDELLMRMPGYEPEDDGHGD